MAKTIITESYWGKVKMFIKCNLPVYQLGITIIGYFPYHTARIKDLYNKDESISSLVCIPRKFFRELEAILTTHYILDNKAVYIINTTENYSEGFAIMFKDSYCLIGGWDQVTDYDGYELVLKVDDRYFY